MNCRFCNQPCKESDDPKWASSTVIGVQICDQHPYAVMCYYYKDKPFDSPITYEFVVPYKDKDWCFTYDIQNCYTLFTLNVWPGNKRWAASKPPVFTSENANITPENALAKLPTIITFS